MVKAALAKCRHWIGPEIDDLHLGSGSRAASRPFNMARVVAVLLGYDNVPGTTVTRYWPSSLQATRMAFPRDQGRRGPMCSFVAGVECVSRFAKGSSDSPPTTRNRRSPPAATNQNGLGLVA